MLNEIIEKYKNYSNGSGYDFLINVNNYNELIKIIQEQKEEIKTLDENLHTVKIGRNDLIEYVKQVNEENKELKEELIDAYQKRGDMYVAGEKEGIEKRIIELEQN